ncbi:rRNA methyltransferase [Rhodoblastus sphagnicola]|uniref:Ribosomal RNA large subunit methyltransferase E n=1 Tax=Rhodoblastus sphagnicola TaxID=333368 RepID=A0A2S6N7F8_9HYPH|nr:RlmE family RNA methyltransferase [Rhodoblastus sphagnicola]MBB4196238.1 23S rRNA (uridine2552-2'-O)-methyltransferase [Rhodoblastus sphagnicola]PPQ30562.1 rRNA methyltransferase [Rhodoblastus sphagnicola]
MTKSSGGSGGGEGGRGLKTRVKTARKRTLSSNLWLSRQLNDPYVARAKREGYRSRAAFKLVEIDEKYHLLKPGQRIVDLGAAPGGWSQVAAKKVKSVEGKGCVVGLDLLDIEPIPGVVFAVQDFMADEAPVWLKSKLGGAADGVISDMAGNTTGHKPTDHLRIVHLGELAAAFAGEVLTPGGYFLCKLFQGGETGALVTQLKRDFSVVRHVKPQASRADSSELYVLATGFRGARGEDAAKEDAPK